MNEIRLLIFIWGISLIYIGLCIMTNWDLRLLEKKRVKFINGIKKELECNKEIRNNEIEQIKLITKIEELKNVIRNKETNIRIIESAIKLLGDIQACR